MINDERGPWTPPQDQYTQMTMAVLASKRGEMGWTQKQTAEHLEEVWNYRITYDEYRCLEQGFTKRVPLAVVLYLGMSWGMYADQLFPTLNGEVA